jgi:GLPGLI family protein
LKTIKAFTNLIDGVQNQNTKTTKEADEEDAWYFDFTTNKMNMQKQIVGTNFVVEDSIPNIQWKLTNEHREIAGYNCRKAVGKIYDDVYVFAFLYG